MFNFTKTSLFLVFFSFINTAVHAQEKVQIKGIVRNQDGKALSNASVTLFYEGEKDSLRTVTNDKGVFQFSNTRPANTGIVVSYIGYDVFARYYDYRNTSGEQNITDITMTPGGKTLDNVVVQASKVQIKEDTVSFKIDSTMFRKNDNVEEVIKKLPGVEVDKTGNITAQGQAVTKVKVNGKEFFGGDVTTATRQLNADMVDKIDIIDDYGDQAAFTGVKNGEATKTLNIQLKKEKNKGYFGNASLGAGTEDRYANSVTINRFNNNQQISLIGNINNTNASTFNFGSMGGAMGGMARSMVGMVGGTGNTGNGIATTKSIGLNYRDQWNEKISVYGSYSYTKRGTTTLKDVFRQNADEFSSVSGSNDYSLNDNHRLSFNMEYKIDSFNYLKFNPTINYSETHSTYREANTSFDSDGEKVQQGSINDRTVSRSPNITGSLLFNHRFDKKGRIISFNLNAGTSGTEGDDLYNNVTTYYNLTGGSRDSLINQYITQDNNNYNYGASISYIEPLNKKQSLELNYSYNKSFTGIDRENFAINNGGGKEFVDSLSNIYDNEYITNRVGLNFRNNQKKFNYTVGLAVQPATIKSNSETTDIRYSQSLINYYPVVRFAYNFSRSRSFSVNYNGSTRQPSYQQLQPASDRSNPQYVTIGNPDLRPEFTNNISMRYNNFDFITGNVFFGNLNFSFVKDKIVNDVSYLRTPAGQIISQETRYINRDGYFSGSGFYAFSKPFQNRKYVLNYGGNIMYTNNLSYNEGIKNIGKNWIVGQRFNATVTIKKWLETTGGVNFTVNDNNNSVLKRLNLTTKAWSLTHNSRIFLPKDLTFTYDLDKTINDGYASNVDANPFIINASLEKLVSTKFNASVRINAYDLLNENTNVSRSVNGISVIDTRTNRLGRYFMASLIFRFNKFNGQAGASAPPPPPGMHGGMRMTM